VRFAQLTLETAEPEALEPFYRDGIGLPPADTSVSFRRGTACTHHIAFRVADAGFESAKARLAGAAGLLIEDGRDEFDFAFWDARACYALDPAGNIVELIALRGLPGEGDMPLGLAEVGLPVADVLATVELLQAQLGITTWDGDPPSPRFTATGARGATFIVVPLERAWYPTDRPNEPARMTVVMEGVRDAEVTIGDARIIGVADRSGAATRSPYPPAHPA
jgi:catechol-2,3-dioxygenase